MDVVENLFDETDEDLLAMESQMEEVEDEEVSPQLPPRVRTDDEEEEEADEDDNEEDFSSEEGQESRLQFPPPADEPFPPPPPRPPVRPPPPPPPPKEEKSIHSYRVSKGKTRDIHFLLPEPVCEHVELSGPSGTFSSPGFPERYPALANCTTNITVADGSAVRITFHLFDVRVKNNSQCIVGMWLFTALETWR